MKKVKVDVFRKPLNIRDSGESTYGCRNTHPKCCGSNLMPKVCAFVRKDGMCLKPPASWAKQYKVLKEKK